MKIKVIFALTSPVFRNINGWHYELIRKNDNKLMRVYGSVNSTIVSFERVPAGDYIVKAIPIVECGDITPGEFEVTVPAITAGSEISDPIYLWQRDADALPFQYVGKDATTRVFHIVMSNGVCWMCPRMPKSRRAKCVRWPTTRAPSPSS